MSAITENERMALYADGINLAAERGLGPHPLPESYVRAVQSGVDAVLAALHEEYAIATYYSEDGFPTYYPTSSREEALEWKRPFAHRIPWDQYPVKRLAGEWTRMGEQA